MFILLIPLTSRIYVVSPDVVPKYPYGNCLYIDDDVPVVIDCGAGSKAFSAVPCDRINMLFFSHFHFDHIHGDKLFSNAEIMVGIEESQNYLDEKAYIACHGYDRWDELMPGIKRQAYGQVVPLDDDVLARPGFRHINLAGTFADHTQFSLGHTEVTCLHLPGHTIGHYGFYMEKENILFSADIDLAMSGPWYSSASADVGDLIRSVETIKAIDPRIVVPSHRRIQTEDLIGQLSRYIQIVLDRQDKILELLKNPHTIHTLASYNLIFGPNRNIYEIFWEKMTIKNHLDYLLALGVISEIQPGLFVRK